MAAEKTPEQKMAAYERMIAGARKGGKAKKTFSSESKNRQINGARKGGSATKHFTKESKQRQKEGARKGGLRRAKVDVTD